MMDQFNAKSAQFRGLHHVFVEVGDHERERSGGPAWLARRLGQTPQADSDDPWQMVGFSSLPWVHPRFREAAPNDVAMGVSEDRLIRDGGGRPRAVFEPMRLRT